uniref:Uncharacterized protein n=1 Tax=Mycena chlorophos TaxID=658473 RepID=A0ABQ0LIT9_MYCCL|nr:predicted protein [Mycena chlorophos]
MNVPPTPPATNTGKHEHDGSPDTNHAGTGSGSRGRKKDKRKEKEKVPVPVPEGAEADEAAVAESLEKLKKKQRKLIDMFRTWVYALTGTFNQNYVVPYLTNHIEHYEKRHQPDFKDVCTHVQQLIDESRTAIDLGRRFPEQHRAMAFTAIANAGLKDFRPNVSSAVQSTYNQIHCHLAVSTFQLAAEIQGPQGLRVYGAGM